MCSNAISIIAGTQGATDRFVPVDSYNLKRGGKVRALQVDFRSENTIVFRAGMVGADISILDMHDLHLWLRVPHQLVSIHDAVVDSFAPFNVKTAGAPSLKRPENGSLLRFRQAAV